jgi:hypothetical protein
MTPFERGLQCEAQPQASRAQIPRKREPRPRNPVLGGGIGREAKPPSEVYRAANGEDAGSGSTAWAVATVLG